MNTAKIAVSIDPGLLKKIDGLVEAHVFHSRSQAIQLAVQEKINRLDKNRLARECARLNPQEEQALADEGLATELEQWPEY
jgi:metal-responsive CopG/Arc/MetJ family transcriptional regulator